MAVEENSFQYIWNFKNFSFSFYDTIFCSPPFRIDTLDGTEWNLILDNCKYKDNICCRIQRGRSDSGPDEVQIDYELSFLGTDGSVLRSEMVFKRRFKKGDFDSDSFLFVAKDEILNFNKDLFIPEDTLTIRCRIWSSKKSILLSGWCFAETLVDTECRAYVGTTEKFSNIMPGCKTLVRIKPSPMKIFFSSVNLIVTADGKLDIEMKPVNYDQKSKYVCKIYIRDLLGNKIKSGHGEFVDLNSQIISLTLPKEHLMENKGYYLPNDILTFEFEIIFPTGKEIEKVDESDKKIQAAEESLPDTQGTNAALESENRVVIWEGNAVEEIKEPDNESVCTETQTMISIKENKTRFLDENRTETVTTLAEDLISLFSNGTLCDVEIQTKTEIFTAHIAVLSARSPVFKAMFSNDMTEKTNHYVDIFDLDAETVRRMLTFIYSDTLDDLDYESATNLYFAADKYNIASLKQRCSSFLKLNLSLSNCCDILLIADDHQDKDLKSAVRNYIAENNEMILISEAWKHLQVNHPQLVIEVLRDLYMNNRGH